MDARISKLVELLESDDPHIVNNAFNIWKQELQGDFKFADVEFPDINLKVADLSGFELSGARFVKTQLSGANFTNAKLYKARFIEVDAPGANFHSARLVDAVFDSGDLSRAIFIEAMLHGAKFLGPDLSEAQFNGSDISSAIILPRKVNSGTLFDKMKYVKGCQIEIYTLEALNDNYGGLTKGDRILMDIRSDVALLRFAYSGFLQWLHAIALVVFVFPYVWFLVKSWTVARFKGEGQNGIALWEAGLRYIVTGGEGWREGWSVNWWSFIPFLLALIYNVLRLVLLVKTKKLEMKESISGLPALFFLRGRWNFWGWAYNVAHFGFWFNLVVVAVHTYHFLQMVVPIG